MIAILKRELKAYFTSVIGWIFMAAFFFVFNLYFVANNLIYGTPYLSYSLNNVAFVLLIIIPILAMRSMSVTAGRKQISCCIHHRFLFRK